MAIRKGLKALTQARLQGLIGTELLDRLESIVPVLSSDENETLNLFRKERLAQLADAFIGDRIFADPEARRMVLESQSPDTIQKLIEKTETSHMSEDDLVEKLVQRGWKDRSFALTVLEELGSNLAHAPAVQVSSPEIEVIEAPEVPFKPLKDYQTAVYFEAVHQLRIPRSRFILQMPTGSGKTRVAMEILANFLNEATQNTVVIWFAHSGELCEQAYEAFNQVWQHVGRDRVTVLRSWGSGKPNFEIDGRILVIAGFQKMYSLVTRSNAEITSLQKRVHLMIIDEAHKVVAPTYLHTVKAIIGDETRIIGLTATPGRSATNETDNKALSNFFFQKKVGIGTPSEQSVIEYLRERRVLARAKFVPLITNLTYELSSSEKTALERFFDFPAVFIKRLSNDDVRNVEILKRLKLELEQEKRILLFACSVEHSKFLTSCLSFYGAKAGHIDGKMSSSHRHSIISDFRNGKLQILSNYGVLSTGFDVPSIDVVFITRPTASVVLYSQMIGRGLRGPAIGGTENCKIIDVKDNIIGYSNEESVYDYFGYYWS